MEQLMQAAMKEETYYAAIKKNILKEVATFRRYQKENLEQQFLRIPYFKSLTGFKDHGQFAKSADIGESEQEHTETASPAALTFCFTPPYDHCTALSYGHPHSLVASPDELNEVIFNPFSLANCFTGDVSLSVISGQNYSDFYGGGGGSILNGLNYQSACAMVLKTLRLPTPFEGDIMAKITVHIQLPANANEVVERVPGSAGSIFSGLVGAEGYMLVSVYFQRAGLFEGASTRNNFLSSWQAAERNDITRYQSNPSGSLTLKIPSGITRIEIACLIMLNAYSTTGNDLNTANDDEQQYALIDFRLPQLQNTYKILDRAFSNSDHNTAGPVKVNNICVSLEPVFVALPHTE